MKPPALVVDDDPSWQEILSDILIDEGLDVEVASSLAQAMSCLETRSYRFAVVDLSLDASDHRNRHGLDVLAAIQRSAPRCDAVLLTGFATVEVAVKVLTERMARTCLEKETFSRHHLAALVRQTLGRVDGLTTREQEVLQLLCQGLTNQQLADQLHVSPNTIKQHLKAVFDKLGVKTRSAAVAHARSLQL